MDCDRRGIGLAVGAAPGGSLVGKRTSLASRNLGTGSRAEHVRGMDT